MKPSDMKPIADAALPGLPVALQTDAALELFRGALPECRDGLDLIDVQVFDVQYRQGTRCVVLYRLKFRDRTSGRSSRQFLSARLLRVDESPPSPPEALLARYDARGKNVIRTAMAYLPEARMLVYAFPVDTSLPWLFDALDPAAMKKELNQMWAQRRTRVREVSVQLLGYTPQARAAIIYEALAESKDTGLPEIRRLIGKTHAHKSPARLFAAAWALWRAADGRFGLAPPVGYIGSLRMTLQEQLRGVRLGALASSPSIVSIVRETARAIAAMHGLSIPLTTQRTPKDEAHVVHRWGSVLAGIRPDLAPRVESLRDRIAAGIESRARVAGPVHGDFHHTNVIVDGDRIALIDLDELAYGDPLVDVGRFLASLRIPALREFGDPDGLAPAREAFLDEYLARVSEDRKRVRLFEAASLLTAASSSFRIQRAGWEEAASMLVEEAERVFREADSGPVVSRARRAPDNARPLEGQVRWASNGVYAHAILDPYIQEAYGADVRGCRATIERRSEKGYRVRYDLSGRQGDKKWTVSLDGIASRRRGGRVLLRRLEALRTALDDHPEAPLLPRPVAYVSDLSMIVVEPPQGRRFASVVGTPDAAEAATKLARALVAVHGACVELDRSRSLEDEGLALGRRVEKLRSTCPELYGRATVLLEEVKKLYEAVPARAVPVLRPLDPQHILCAGERIAISEVDQIALSHPLVDVGNLLAKLRLMGIKQGKVQASEEAADRIRDAYVTAVGSVADGMSVCEAGALLGLASAQAERDPQAAAAEHLFRLVEASLAKP